MGVIGLITAIAIVGYQSTALFERIFATEAYIESESEGSEEKLPVVSPTSLRSDAVLVCQSPQFFTPQGAEAMRQVVAELESLPEVDSVLWMDRVPILNIFGLPEPLLPRSTASLRRFEEARRKAAEHPLVHGQLLSSDAQTMLLLVNFDFAFVTEDRQCREGLRETAERAAARFPNFDVRFLVTGRVPTFLTALANHEANQVKYQLIAYGMIFLMSLVLFRGLAAVLIVAAAPALGVFWTLGIIRFFDFQSNPFNDVVLPVLISLVAFTDGVHLMVQIRRNRAAGMSTRAAAQAGVRQVGLACFLTSLTTAIGFGSLSLAQHEIVREFGLCCVIGVVLTFVAVITSIPLLCSSWLGRSVHRGLEKSLVDRNLVRIGGVIDWVLGRTGWLSAVAVIATGVLFAVSLTLRPDERQSNALPPASEAARAIAVVDEAMGGTELARIDVQWALPRDPETPELMEVLGEIDQLLTAEPLIGHPLSVRDLLRALPGEGAPADRMSLLELLPPPLKRAFYTPERRSAQVSFRVRDLGIAAYGPVFQRIASGLRSIEARHPDFQLVMGGSAVWRWENLFQIVVDLAWSLGTASLIIFLVLAIVYRSLRIGLISIIPNVFPLAVAGTYLVLSGQSLEVVSVCAFTVCLGIAVDDTIHFLTRYLEERETATSDAEAIRRAFVGVGTALILTTVVLVCGFLTVLFSDSHDHQVFAAMGAITVSSALFADLVFLPAILARFAPPRQEQGQNASQKTALAIGESRRDLGAATSRQV